MAWPRAVPLRPPRSSSWPEVRMSTVCTQTQSYQPISQTHQMQGPYFLIKWEYKGLVALRSPRDNALPWDDPLFGWDGARHPIPTGPLFDETWSTDTPWPFIGKLARSVRLSPSSRRVRQGSSGSGGRVVGHGSEHGLSYRVHFRHADGFALVNSSHDCKILQSKPWICLAPGCSLANYNYQEHNDRRMVIV